MAISVFKNKQTNKTLILCRLSEFLHRRNTNEPDQEIGFYLFRVSRTSVIITAGEKPNDMISCELSIAESTRVMELKWRKHRQSTGSLRGPGRRSATALGNVLHHAFY